MPSDRRMRLGIVADPGLAARLVQSVAKQLPSELREQVHQSGEYDMEVVVRSLPLNEDGVLDVSATAADLAREHDWDLTVVVTELPRRDGTRPLVVDAQPGLRTAIVSLPALGVVRLRARVTAAIARAVSELRASGEPSEDTQVFQTSSGLLGRTRLLIGMIRINRPWRLVPSLSSAMAAAAATAAFGIFYSSIWQMAASLSPLRLSLISVMSIAAMVTWLVAYNRLWDPPSRYHDKDQALLYNVAGISSILVGVTLMYISLYVATVVAAFTVISWEFLGSTLERPAEFTDYLVLSWLSASMGTIAGALGSSAEDDDDIKRATFGNRERERRNARSDNANAPENRSGQGH